ncbi:MAG TPA: HAMP domain-containing sensor histidine kinase [Polyangia bacterium]|jgi:signal transduction histidine kinase|nr:HAMP domain-containing sensor histidine kinase [Polyangia bacterium]
MGRGQAWIGTARRYASAGGLSAFVTLGRLKLDPWLGHSHNRHLFFLPTVILTAWLWGFAPALFSAAIFAVALRAFWTDHHESFLHANSDIALFLLVSAAICAIVRSLQHARETADEATRSREQLLAVVAHDLGNPLHAVRLAEQRIRARSDDARAVERSLATIEHATTRMDHLLRDLVDTTRLSRDELVVTPAPELVAPLVAEVTEIYAPRAQEAGLALERDGPEDDAAAVSCDRDRIMQVLGNLLGNAIKFTPPGGRVALHARVRDGAIRFEVEDTGAGIRPEHLPHVFERFRSFDARGTGLGLFIARSLVVAHGSELHVRSTLGFGSAFWFELPRLAPAPRR